MTTELNIAVDQARCHGARCPSRLNCKHHMDKSYTGEYAAFDARRLAGDSACDQYQAIKVLTTFKD